MMEKRLCEIEEKVAQVKDVISKQDSAIKNEVLDIQRAIV